MSTTERNLRDTKSQSQIPMADKTHGFFNIATIALTPPEVFSACQDSSNITTVLKDLPKGFERFIELNLLNAEETAGDEYAISWETSPDSKVRGTLTFLLKKAPGNRGTIISAEATFDILKTNDADPSVFMNIFLKRMKALVETGEIPTTTGQPSGREELISSHKKTLH